MICTSRSRIFGSFLSLFVFCFATHTLLAQSCDPTPSGLIGWWPGEGNAFDRAGLNNGTIINGAGFVPGLVGQAFNFNGSGQAVDVGIGANLQVQDFTIEAWVRRDDANIASHDPYGAAAIFGAGWGGYGLIITDDGRVGLGKIGYSAVFGTATITDTSSFHHIAATKSGTNVFLYLDGIGESAGPYDPGFVFNGHVVIGARGSDYVSSFIGSIDEVSVYNRALGTGEIAAISTAGSAGKCAAPQIYTQPNSVAAHTGDNVTFSVAASGTPQLYYQWYFNGQPVNGAIDSSLALTGVQFTNAGNYSVRITNAFGTKLSAVALLTVSSPGVCAAPPAGIVGWWKGDNNLVDVVGTNNGTFLGNAALNPAQVSLGFALDGSGDGINLGTAANLRFQDFTIETWIQRASATQASLDFGGGEIFGFGYGGYTLGLTDDGSLYLTRVGIDNVTLAAAVTDTAFHHVAVTKSGTNVFFYVDGVAFNVPPYNTTYTFGTAAMIGLRSDTMGNGFLGVIDEVSVYNRPLAAVEVLQIVGAGPAGKCTEATPPTINGQPSDIFSQSGKNVAFNILAAGSPPLSFQWQFQGTNVAGATNYLLNLSNVQFPAEGTYQVIVTNQYGSITSSPASLILQSPPVISTQPQPTAVPAGSTALFVVGVSGSPHLYFQWQFNGSDVPGATNYSVAIANVQSNKLGDYSVIITNSFGSVTSLPAALTLNFPVTITNQPLSQAMPKGANPSFSVGVSGSGLFRYQWQLGAVKLVGATNALLSLNNVQSTNAGGYSVVVSNDFTSTTSLVATLTITNPTCVLTPPGLVGSWAAEGSTADTATGQIGALVGNASYTTGKVGQAFAFDGTGDAIGLGNPLPLRLQDLTIMAWVKRASISKASNNSGGGEVFGYGQGGYVLGLVDNGQPFFGQVGISAVYASFQIVDTNWHQLAVTRGDTNVVFFLDGTPYPAPGYSATFTFNNNIAIGARGDNFQNSFLGWLDEVDIYNRPLTTAEVQGIYFSTSVGKCPLSLTWVTQPASQTVALGASANFSASVSGTRPVIWQWFLNGAPLAGATNSTLVVSNTTYFQAGAYSVAATNPLGNISSSNAILTLVPPPLFGNGSFESGTFNGWIITDIANPLTPVSVRASGYNSGFGFFSATATDGNYSLVNGFDGNGPGRIRAAFEVFLPPAPTILSFDYHVGWDMANFDGSTKPRVFVVTIEPAGGGSGLATNAIFTAEPGTSDYDTGPRPGSVNLSSFAGQAIRISFDIVIPEPFTGPGFFQLDNVRLTYPPVPQLAVTRSGTNAVFSWPALFTNYVVQQTTNLNNPPVWVTLPAGAVTRGPTNDSLSAPMNLPKAFYRLKSP